MAPGEDIIGSGHQPLAEGGVGCVLIWPPGHFAACEYKYSGQASAHSAAQASPNAGGGSRQPDYLLGAHRRLSQVAGRRSGPSYRLGLIRLNFACGVWGP